MLTEDQRQRFWAKVAIIDDADSCWHWTAAIDRGGYGRTAFHSRPIGAHRIAYALANGLDVPPELCVLHRCDNRKCVRPSHLFLGTHKDNMRDMQQKGRVHTKNKAARLRNPADLTPREIEEIRTLRQQGRFYHVISRMFRVAIFTVCKIEQGRL